MSVKSAERVLRLLEQFDRMQRPQTLGELVRATGWPQSSLAAMLATLIETGYIFHDYRHRTYVPTSKVTHLGEWIPDTEITSEPAVIELLQQLHNACGETVVVAEQTGLFARYVKVLPARGRLLSAHTQTGVLRPICSSATGWSLLSQQSDAAIRSTVRDVNRLRAEGTRALLLKDVRVKVAEARRFGFVVSRHAVKEGVGMVAMPVRYPWRGRRFAVGVGAPVPRLDRRLSSIVSDITRCITSWEKLVLGPEVS